MSEAAAMAGVPLYFSADNAAFLVSCGVPIILPLDPRIIFVN